MYKLIVKREYQDDKYEDVSELSQQVEVDLNTNSCSEILSVFLRTLLQFDYLFRPLSAKEIDCIIKSLKEEDKKECKDFDDEEEEEDDYVYHSVY